MTIQAGDQETTGGKNFVKNHVDNVTELASDFERNEKGRLVFAWKKPPSEPTTVRGGKGKDKIFFKSTSNLIKYKSGDGLDTIHSFNSTDSLSISGGSYSTQASSEDLIVAVGKEKITLKEVKGNAVIINKKNCP